MNISLKPLDAQDLHDFPEDVRKVFSIAIAEQFGIHVHNEYFRFEKRMKK